MRTNYEDNKGNYVQVSMSGLVQPEPEIVIVDAQEEVWPSHPPSSSEQTSSLQTTPLPGSQEQQATTTVDDQQHASYHHTQKEGGGSTSIFDCILCGDEKRSHVKPGSHFSFKLCGNTHVTILNHPPQHPDDNGASEYQFYVLSLCGDTRLYVPTGTSVSVRRFSLCGNRTINDLETNNNNTQESSTINNSSSAPSPTPARVQLNVFQLCGDVRISSNINSNGWLADFQNNIQRFSPFRSVPAIQD